MKVIMEVNMKKLVFAAVFIVSLAVGLPVFAQNQKDDRDSEYYYVNITLEKIFPYRKGYVVQYRKGFFQYGRAYLPAEWFTNADSTGEVVALPRGKAWPTMTVFYKDGVFSHLRLYVHRVPTHETWGSVPQNVNLDDKFDNIDSIKIEY
jgi:hypothetical protein